MRARGSCGHTPICGCLLHEECFIFAGLAGSELEYKRKTMLHIIIGNKSVQGPVVQRVDNAIHRINHYLVHSVVCFVNTYPLDSDLSGG